MSIAATSIKTAPIRKSIVVKASQERAFQVFTAGMTRWWRADHHIAPKPFATIVVEPKAGGRWFERDAEGAECEWGKVLAWNPPHGLTLSWQLNGEWKYDADFVTELEIRFVAEGPKQTRVELEHRDLEKYGAQAESVRAVLDAEDGWNGAIAAYAAEVGREGR